MSSDVVGPRVTARTRARTRLLQIARAAATPLVPEDYLDMVAPLHNPGILRGRIVAIHPETRDAATIVIRPGVGWRGHRPGQYLRIGVDVDGVRLWRAYSVTAGPATGRDLVSITVKAIPDGVVSNHLVRRARPGTVLHLDQATGDFTLPIPTAEQPLPGKWLFVTAGSGITPIMGMLRHYLHDLRDVVVVHAAATADEVIFGGELRGLAKAGRIRLVESHDDVDGFLTADRLVALVPDLAERETYACGPTPLLDLVEQLYDDKGIGEQLHTERFRPTVVAPGEGGTVTFGRQGLVVEAGGATPILDAGEAAGALMPSGCRMGICFGCVVPLTEGAVRDLRNGDLTAVDGEEPIAVQTCISAAAGPCRLDL
ncbi:MAG: ferredoxin reductase [Nocardioidaceae bacterium]